jgi:hypothetical protein
VGGYFFVDVGFVQDVDETSGVQAIEEFCAGA